MAENMKKFLEAVSERNELTAKINTMTKEELLALAKELGIELTDADFAEPAGEMNDDELDAVTGGGDCYCYAGGGGGGTKNGNNSICACVLFGVGVYEEDGKLESLRCKCIAYGHGTEGPA